MSLEGEVLPDWAEAREECLRAFAIARPTHAALTFTCGLVAVLGPIIQACSGFDEHVFDVRQFRDVGLGGRVAAQLVGDDLARHGTGTKHA